MLLCPELELLFVESEPRLSAFVGVLCLEFGGGVAGVRGSKSKDWLSEEAETGEDEILDVPVAERDPRGCPTCIGTINSSSSSSRRSSSSSSVVKEGSWIGCVEAGVGMDEEK